MKSKFILSTLLFSSLAFCQLPGEFDTTFGNNGKVTMTPSTGFYMINDMALQSDGKIVTVGNLNGNFGVARYLSNGNLDTSFGTNGILNIDFYGYVDIAKSLTIQADGKILVTGSAVRASSGETSFAIIRLNTDGSLDTSFGTSGKFAFNFGTFSTSSNSETIGIQPDGKILIAGSANTTGTENFAIARLNIDGSLDTNFSNDGKQTKIMSTGKGVILKMKILSDGKILLGGYTNNNNIGLLKLLPDGSFDTSFNTDGSKVYTASTISGDLSTMTFLQDNSILYAGSVNNDVKVFKFDSNLNIINSFGINGSTTVDIDNGSFEQNVKKITLDSLENFYLVGSTITGGSFYFYTMNFTSNGTLNNNFSYDGKQLINFANNNSYAYTCVLQQDSKLLIAGSAVITNQSTGAIARLHVQSATLGINDSDKNNIFSIFPNPTEDFINITKINKSLLNQNIEVIDASGRVLLKVPVNSENLQLNISNLNAGVYYFKIGDITKKIIKK